MTSQASLSLSLPLTKVTDAQYRKRFRASYNYNFFSSTLALVGKKKTDKAKSLVKKKKENKKESRVPIERKNSGGEALKANTSKQAHTFTTIFDF